MNKLTLIFLAILASFKVGAQTTTLDSLIDYIMIGDEGALRLLEEQNEYHFIYATAAYSPKTFYAGREIGTNLANASASIFYFTPKGFFLGVSGAGYDQLDPTYSMTSLSAGYSARLKKSDHVRVRASLGHNIFAKTTDNQRPKAMETLGVGSTLYNKKLGARLDYSLLAAPGEGLTHQISADFYSKLTIARFGKSNKLSLMPEISFFISSEWVEYIERSPFPSRFPTTPVLISEEQFGLLNTQLVVPLLFSAKSFEIEASYTYHMPRSLDPLYYYDKASQWNISVGYLFGFDKKKPKPD